MGKIPDKTIVEKYGSIEAYQEHLHKKLSGKHFYTNGIEDKKFADDEDIPEGWYRGRTNCGKGTSGYIWINNGKEQKLISPDKPIPDNWVTGTLPQSNDHKQKISKALKGKKRTEEQRKRISESHRTIEYQEKINATRKQKYGVENFFQNTEICEKAITKAKSKDSRNKAKQTNLLKLGVEYPMQSETVKEKSKKTCLARYGVPCVLQANEIKEKSKVTCRIKYGTDYASQAKKVKDKVKQTSMKRYGTENPAQSEQIKNKMRNTNIERRGVPYPVSSEEVFAKQITTNRERYGVDYNIQLPQAKLYSNNSKPNQDFASLLDKNNISYVREFSLMQYSFDFKVNNILIEIDPYATHNSLWSPFGRTGISYDYHYKKSKCGWDNGYTVIHVFDWDNQDKIINLLRDREILYARNTKIVEVPKLEADAFLKNNHLQNTCKGQIIRLGLKYNDELISIMTFGKPRYNKKFQWELLRYCTTKLVIGGEEKLFKYFIDNYHPESIVSYCDKSKFSGKIYEKLGFTILSESGPSKHWYSPIEKIPHITDNFLRQLGYDKIFSENKGKGTSNEDLIISRGYVPIYDCGQTTYIINNL